MNPFLIQSLQQWSDTAQTPTARKDCLMDAHMQTATHLKTITVVCFSVQNIEYRLIQSVSLMNKTNVHT